METAGNDVERKTYVPGRSNVIIRLPGKGSEQLSLVGSHLDVVPADPESWNVDPFKLTIDGDQLYGRGTTDCLGHVALMTTLFTQLSEIDGFELNTSFRACSSPARRPTARDWRGWVSGEWGTGSL